MFPIPSPNFAEGLSVIESYQYFDRPVLFSCHDSQSRAYLAVWADESEDTNQETWVFTPVHEGILNAVRSGGMELQAAFRNGLNGKAFLVYVDWDTRSSSVEEVNSADLSDELLPEPGERVTLPSGLLEHSYSLPQIATQSRKSISDLRLIFENPTLHEAPARLVGNFLQTYQACLEALVHVEVQDDPNSLGRIPNSVMNMAKLNVQPFMAGSFSIRLETAQESAEPLFWHEEPVTRALKQMTDIISAKSQETVLQNYSSRITGRFAKRYILLLQNLVAGKADLVMEWANPYGQVGVAEISSSEAVQAIRVVDIIAKAHETSFEVIGELIALHSRTGAFEIFDPEHEIRYQGKVASDFNVLGNYMIGQTYIARIHEILEVNSTTLEERTKYRLIDLVRDD